MQQDYDVLLGNKSVGTVKVSVAGLYYRFFCRLKLNNAIKYRLIVQSETGREDLGILLPYGDTFGIDHMIAIKRLGRGNLTFLIVEDTRFRQICPNKPFEYLSDLKYARIEEQAGKIGIAIYIESSSRLTGQ